MILSLIRAKFLLSQQVSLKLCNSIIHQSKIHDQNHILNARSHMNSCSKITGEKLGILHDLRYPIWSYTKIRQMPIKFHTALAGERNHSDKTASKIFPRRAVHIKHHFSSLYILLITALYAPRVQQ